MRCRPVARILSAMMIALLAVPCASSSPAARTEGPPGNVSFADTPARPPVEPIRVPVAVEPGPALPMAVPVPLPMPGSDRDLHGCIPSAGYRWCERLAACVRSWELAAERGLPPGEAGFRAYCG